MADASTSSSSSAAAGSTGSTLRPEWQPLKENNAVTLYWNDKSQPSRAVYQLLLGLDSSVPVKLVQLDLRKQEQKSAEYVAINPKAQVPTIYHNGRFIPESTDIMHYLCDNFKELARYDAPKDSVERGKIDDWLKYSADFVRDITTGLTRTVLIFKDASATAEKKAKLPGVLDDWESRMITKFLTSEDQPTIADFQLLHEIWGPIDLGIVSLDGHPKLAAWFDLMKARPNSKKAYGTFGWMMTAARGVLGAKSLFGSKTGTL